MSKDQWLPGRMLREARGIHGLSQQEAAKRTDISVGWWRAIELGYIHRPTGPEPVNPTPTVLVRCARTVGVEPQKLLEAAGYDYAHTEVSTLRQKLDTMLKDLNEVDIAQVMGFIQGLKVVTVRGD